MLLDTDLIVASATAPGQGGIGVVRVSGPGALTLAEQLRPPAALPLAPRQATYARLQHNAQLLDEGIVIAYPGPASFTGEDVVELQVHGSPAVLQMLVDACCALGARLARPGEFSERAFLNNKLDLAQAEAIADLIAAGSAQAARAAVRSLQGAFSEAIGDLADDLEQVRIIVEASIDFPEEGQDFMQGHHIEARLDSLQQRLADVLAQAQRGRLLKEGLNVAIVGAPNAGKSSLINALSGEDAAIVADIPGTTRDLLKVDFVVEGVPVRLVDTAGLRTTDDQIEQQGIQRARREAEQADVLLLLLDASLDEPVESQRQAVLALAGVDGRDDRVMAVLNKIDLVPDAQFTGLCVSALNGSGLAELRRQLASVGGVQSEREAPFIARARHVQHLRQCAESLQIAQALVQNRAELEMLAEELRSGHLQLGEIVGITTADDLLGRIFSEFCIGK